MAGCEIDRLRSLADRSTPDGVARAIRDPGAERFHAGCLSDLLHLPAARGRNSILPPRLDRVLGGDDLFCRGLRNWLRDFHSVSHRESLVFDGRGLAQRIARGRGDETDQFYRALRTSARRGISVRACGWGSRGDVGSMAAPKVDVLGNAAAGSVHVCLNGMGALSL